MSEHTKWIPPKPDLEAFNCANCRVYARQDWYYLRVIERADGFGTQKQDRRFRVSYCASCGENTIWREGAIVYPPSLPSEMPSADLPPDIVADFQEAREIAAASPRGAAALLRLAIQKLCKHLGQPGKNINDDISAMVAAGLPSKVQQALDIVRVVGNDAVHPGTLDLRDDIETVHKLFRLVNFIANKMITEPNEIDSLYSGLPADKVSAIAKRDAKAKGK